MALEWAESGARNTGLQAYKKEGLRVGAYRGGANQINNCLLTSPGGKSSGLWQFEVSVGRYGTLNAWIGVGDESALPAAGTYMAQTANEHLAVYLLDGVLWRNGASISSAYTGHPIANYATKVFTFIFNAATRKMWVKIDGVYAFVASGDPVAGTNEAATIGGSFAISPMITMDRFDNGAIFIHQPGELLYPVSGVTPFGFEAATITFASGAITDASGSSVTESGVIASVCDRATGAQIATTTANVSGGAATLSFTADVTNGQAVVVHFHNASGTFKAGGFLTTVAV